jgi:hypothetical protein
MTAASLVRTEQRGHFVPAIANEKPQAQLLRATEGSDPWSLCSAIILP